MRHQVSSLGLQERMGISACVRHFAFRVVGAANSAHLLKTLKCRPTLSAHASEIARPCYACGFPRMAVFAC